MRQEVYFLKKPVDERLIGNLGIRMNLKIKSIGRLTTFLEELLDFLIAYGSI
jgi:hypothetical protein